MTMYVSALVTDHEFVAVGGGRRCDHPVARNRRCNLTESEHADPESFEAGRADALRLVEKIVGSWLENPEWPTFGPGIRQGPLDPGRTAARVAVQQVVDALKEATQ